MNNSVVLTSDRGSFSDYSGANALGYIACMPKRLVPRMFMDKFFNPPMRAYGNGEAVLAPYALRKVEAILSASGISDVIVSPPEHLKKVVGSSTRVVGITAHDPYGLSPVSTKLSLMFGGGESWTAAYFTELSETIKHLKKKYSFKVFAGGPGIWQLDLKRPDWVDVIFSGEAERDLPPMIHDILQSKPTKDKVYGKDPTIDQIPTIIKPSRYGEVQVTRGCPRGCQFCSITPEMFRSIRLDDIIKEVSVNVEAGLRSIDLVTDDILLYGSSRLKTNQERVVELFMKVKESGAREIYFPHISSPAVKESPETVMDLAGIAEYDKYRGEVPVVGLESGSERIIDKYMRGKAFPWTPSDWGQIICDSAEIMNDACISPCFTMTIGFSDETSDDVNSTIALANRLIDGGYRAFMFPLPVIPITKSRLRKNAFPSAEALPSNYWDLLQLCWNHDLKVIRRMVPDLTYRMGHPLIRTLTGIMMDRIFSGIDNVFEQLRDTKGKKAIEYSNIQLESLFGTMKSIYFIGKKVFGSHNQTIN